MDLGLSGVLFLRVEVEAVEVHDLVPGCHEIADETLFRVIAGIDFSEGAEL